MRIESARLHRVQIPFVGRFGHALSERSRSDAIFVELRDAQGGVGWGEILPRPYVTGETLEGVLGHSGPRIASGLLGLELEDRAAVEAWLGAALPEAGRDLAAFGGFEVALLDLAGRRLGFSLAQILGGTPEPALPAGVVIGFEVATEALRKHCIGLRWKGHAHVKVKVGQPDDIERLAAITRVFGPDVPLRLDANASWTAETAVEILSSLQRHGIPMHSIEQPVPADDLAGMRSIRARCGVPVMADESVCSLADAQRIVSEKAADIFNIRVGKHGGVLAARAIVECARRAEISVHLGTLVGESGVLSRVAEVFGRCVPGFACLDGKGQNRFLLEEDVLRPPGADASNLAASVEPDAVKPNAVEPDAVDLDAVGLGVDVSPEAIERLRVGEPVELHA